MRSMAPSDPGRREGRAFAAAVPAAFLFWAASHLLVAAVGGDPDAVARAARFVVLTGPVAALPLAVLAVGVAGVFYVVFELTVGVRRPVVWAGGTATGILVGLFVGSWSGLPAVGFEILRGAGIGLLTAEVWWRVWSIRPR